MVLRQVPAQDPGVVVVGNEADLERLRLVRRVEAEPPRLRPDLRLRQLADRQEQTVERLAGHPPQEVRLVLVVIGAKVEFRRAGAGSDHARVVPRRQPAAVQRVRPHEEVPELREAVAADARDRRAAGRVLRHEVVDHVAREVLLHVEHVVRHVELGGDGLGVRDPVEAAAGARRALAAGVAEGLHRHADDRSARARQQRRGERRVHAAGHGDEHGVREAARGDHGVAELRP